MKGLLKNLGPILLLIGVAILAVYYFTESTSNVLLASAAALVVVGFFAFIFINRMIK